MNYSLPTPRIVGQYSEEKKGPLLIALCQMHGNEPAGTKAVIEVITLLKKEIEHNSDFVFTGTFAGILGHKAAAEQEKRFINSDLNRIWTDENVKTALRSPNEDPELHEVKEIVTHIKDLLKTYQPTSLVFLDLHTTSAEGGIFAIHNNTAFSSKLALEFHVPVVEGILEGLSGTSLHFFDEGHKHFFVPEELNIPVTTVCFEGGQHQNEESWQNCVSAIINAMRGIGMVKENDVETKHDERLKAQNADKPRLVRMAYRHPITPADRYVMRPGYSNFQSVKKDEYLADSASGPVICPLDGYIVMPLYQSQGSEGFFLVEEVQ